MFALRLVAAVLADLAIGLGRLLEDRLTEWANITDQADGDR